MVDYRGSMAGRETALMMTNVVDKMKDHFGRYKLPRDAFSNGDLVYSLKKQFMSKNMNPGIGDIHLCHARTGWMMMNTVSMRRASFRFVGDACFDEAFDR